MAIGAFIAINIIIIIFGNRTKLLGYNNPDIDIAIALIVIILKGYNTWHCVLVSDLWISISPLTQGKILLFQYMAFLIFHSPNVRVIVFELSGTKFYGV